MQPESLPKFIWATYLMDSIDFELDDMAIACSDDENEDPSRNSKHSVIKWTVTSHKTKHVKETIYTHLPDDIYMDTDHTTAVLNVAEYTKQVKNLQPHVRTSDYAHVVATENGFKSMSITNYQSETFVEYDIHTYQLVRTANSSNGDRKRKQRTCLHDITAKKIKYQ